MGESEGYQIVELPEVDPLLRSEAGRTFARLVLKWLAGSITHELAGHGLFVEVIDVNYLGEYPALGIKYSKPGTGDCSNLVTELATKFLEQTSARNLLDSIVEISLEA